MAAFWLMSVVATRTQVLSLCCAYWEHTPWLAPLLQHSAFQSWAWAFEGSEVVPNPKSKPKPKLPHSELQRDLGHSDTKAYGACRPLWAKQNEEWEAATEFDAKSSGCKLPSAPEDSPNPSER